MSNTAPNALAQLDKAKQALEKARTLPEVKKIKDIAEAARTYAHAAHLGREAQNYAAEIALLASRKAGEILKKLDRNPGRRTDKRPRPAVSPGSYSETLKSTQTSKETARRWQKLAEVPEETVREYINTAHSEESEEEITTAGLLRVAKAGEPKTAHRPPTEKHRKEKLFDFAAKLYQDVAPEVRERELRLLVNELLAHFSVAVEVAV